MKKKILILSSTINFIDIFLYDAVDKLSNDYEIHIITNFKDIKNVYNNSIKTYNYPISRRPSLLFDLWYVLRIVLKTKFINPTYLITVTPKGGFIGSFISLLCPSIIRKHIFTGQLWYNKKTYKRFLLKLIDKFIFYNSHSIIVDSHSQKKFLISENFNSNKISTIFNGSIKGVDFNNFIPNSNLKNKFYKNYNLDADCVTILFIGRINLEKGINLLLNSIKKLIALDLKIHLLLVGRQEIDLNKFIDTYYFHLKKFITIKSFSTSPEKIFPLADIFCLPSSREGFGMSIIEASSCSVPVIGSNIVGIKDAISDNYSGYLFDLSNENDLFNKLKKLVTNPNLRSEFGINGRKYVINNFNKNYVINDLIIKLDLN